MKLYLIRHGQSEANLAKTFSGQCDSPLTEQGRADAARVKKTLVGINFDKVYSSDLSRASETQKIALPDAVCEKTPLLREINVGRLAGTPVEEASALFGEELSENRKKYAFDVYGGESYSDLMSRVRSFLSLMENSPYETVAAFCHGGFIGTALDLVAGVMLDKSSFKCGNCSVSIFEYTDGAWHLNLWNYMGDI